MKFLLSIALILYLPDQLTHAGAEIPSKQNEDLDRLNELLLDILLFDECLGGLSKYEDLFTYKYLNILDSAILLIIGSSSAKLRILWCVMSSPYLRLASGIGSGNTTVQHAKEVGDIFNSAVFRKLLDCNMRMSQIFATSIFWYICFVFLCVNQVLPTPTSPLCTMLQRKRAWYFSASWTIWTFPFALDMMMMGIPLLRFNNGPSFCLLIWCLDIFYFLLILWSAYIPFLV